MAVEYNERIENVNRERKFHQVISIDLFIGSLSHDNISQAAHNLFFDQQNTGGQLHALTIEWQELCQKNIAIQAACVDLQNQIDQLKLEAKELYVHSLPPSPPRPLPCLCI